MIKKYSHYITPLLYLFGIFGTFILYLATKPSIPYSLDSINYIKLAEAIQQGRWYIHIREDYMTTFPPFYSMLISLFEKIFNDFEIAGMFISITAGSLVIGPIIFLAKRFYGIGTAYLTIIFLILNPIYILYSSAILTESLFTFLFISSICVMSMAISKINLLMWLAVGIISGAATQTKDVGIIIIAVSFFYLIFHLANEKYALQKFIFSATMLIGGFLSVYMPIEILSHLDKENYLNMQQNKVNILRQLSLPDQRDLTSRDIIRRELSYDGKNYKKIDYYNNKNINWQWLIKKMLINTIESIKYISLTFFYIFSIFVFIGFLAKKSDNREYDHGLFDSQKKFSSFQYRLFLTFCRSSFTGAQRPERYLVPIIPTLMLFCVIGIRWCKKKINKLVSKKTGLLTIISLIISFLMANVIALNYIANHRLLDEEANISIKGLAMIGIFNDKVNEPKKIMSKNVFLAYYANALPILTPYGEYGEIIKFAKSKKVDFFFLEKSLYAPQLEFLKNSKDSTEELKFILSTTQGNLYKVIY